MQHSTWYSLKVAFGLVYVPPNDAPRPDKSPKIVVKTAVKTPTKKVAENVKYSPQTDTWQRANTQTIAPEPVTAEPFKPHNFKWDYDWDIMKTPINTVEINTERQQLLTENDLKLIRAEGLDEVKAQVIKDYWFRKISRREATKELSKTQEGYGDWVVKNYYTVFNKGIKEPESPTPEEK